MKKLTFILFVAFYSLTATGFSMNLHYCLEELSEVEFFGHQNSCCCGEEESMAGCCEDETFQLSSSDQQLQSTTSFNFEATFIIDVSSNEVLDEIDVASISNHLTSEDPPPPQNRPIWLVNCNFTYYG
ncbi:MAG: hypothetical protein ACFHWX_11085 [Bacteroidota bacterium]